jgi:hypothetical protein
MFALKLALDYHKETFGQAANGVLYMSQEQQPLKQNLIK